VAKKGGVDGKERSPWERETEKREEGVSLETMKSWKGRGHDINQTLKRKARTVQGNANQGVLTKTVL